MNTPDTTTSSLPAHTASSSLLRRWLPLLGAGLLLYWLSQDFLSVNWQLLLQAKVQLATPGAPGKSLLLLSLAMLLAQTLAISSAWGALLWLLLREGVRLLRASTDKRASSDQPAEPSVPLLSSGAAPMQVRVQGPEVVKPELARPSPAQTPHPARRNQFIHFLPASGAQSWPEVRLPPGAPILPAHNGSTQSRSLPGNGQINDLAGTRESGPEKTGPAAQVPRRRPITQESQFVARPPRAADAHNEGERSEDGPGAPEEDGEFLAVLNALGFLPPLTEQPEETPDEKSPDHRSATTVTQDGPQRPDRGAGGARMMTDREKAGYQESSPYDVQRGARDAFQEGNVLDALPTMEQAEKSGEPAPIFVFGNPFEGPLPDVFQHDEDLKRSLIEQKQTAQQPRSPRKQAKARAKQPRSDQPNSQSHSETDR